MSKNNFTVWEKEEQKESVFGCVAIISAYQSSHLRLAKRSLFLIRLVTRSSFCNAMLLWNSNFYPDSGIYNGVLIGLHAYPQFHPSPRSSYVRVKYYSIVFAIFGPHPPLPAMWRRTKTFHVILRPCQPKMLTSFVIITHLPFKLSSVWRNIFLGKTSLRQYVHSYVKCWIIPPTLKFFKSLQKFNIKIIKFIILI